MREAARKMAQKRFCASLVVPRYVRYYEEVLKSRTSPSVPQSLSPLVPQSLSPSVPQSLSPSVPQSLSPSVP